jgi:hypothetical protein
MDVVFFMFLCYASFVTVEDISLLCKKRSIRWTKHILERLFSRGICTDDVEKVLTSGEIIEKYTTDYPFPSVLVLGHTKTGKALHVVCGSNGMELWLITAYFPNPVEWTEDYKQRRKT